MLRQLCLVTSFLLLALSDYASAQPGCPLQDGDLIFIKSQSEQAKLLKLTTNSEWTHVGMAYKRKTGWDVIEAVQPVKWSTLYSFIRRSNEIAFEVRRADFPFNSKKVLAFAEAKLGIDYDLIFAWDQERWYCTELVWKAYNKASGEELGSLQRIGELLNIDHAMIRSEAKKRFDGYGLEYNHEQWKQGPVITPIQMMNSPKLIKIGNQNASEHFQPCLSN